MDVIKLRFCSSKRLQLIENAEKEIKQLDRGVEYTRYQLANIYYPKLKFSFSTREGTRVGSAYVQIRKIKE